MLSISVMILFLSHRCVGDYGAHGGDGGGCVGGGCVGGSGGLGGGIGGGGIEIMETITIEGSLGS